ncbi:unnamed protein product [Miscanthus lutarioriparius]|uniref:Uncharacterized protein n=1 Tax=Miscanthus lutarioriparius TaxID=422564 RepID=A0A811RP75_9POAL|nr:unnamed protein product [Miscanthus lutarioriparius]
MASSSLFQRGERRGRWGSPERTVVWTEPEPKPARKVAVVYYLCHRDGHLDHPLLPPCCSWPPPPRFHGPSQRAPRQRHGRHVLLVLQEELQELTDHRGPDRDADRSTELAIDEISPPPSSSSPDALESCSREVGVIAGGRIRASAVLMHFSCGSMTTVKRGHARTRSDLVTASASTRLPEKEVDAYASPTAECVSVSGGAGVVERDYFSGSLIESSKKRGGDDAPLLKRSSSCNADRLKEQWKVDCEDEYVINLRQGKIIPERQVPKEKR